MTWRSGGRRGRRHGKHSAPGLKTRFSGAKFPVDLPVCVQKGVTHTKVFRLEKTCITVFQPPGLNACEGKALGAVLFRIVCSWAEVRIAWRLSAVLNAERGSGEIIAPGAETQLPTRHHLWSLVLRHLSAQWALFGESWNFATLLMGNRVLYSDGTHRKGRKTLGGETRIRNLGALID